MLYGPGSSEAAAGDGLGSVAPGSSGRSGPSPRRCRRRSRVASTVTLRRWNPRIVPPRPGCAAPTPHGPRSRALVPGLVASVWTYICNQNPAWPHGCAGSLASPEAERPPSTLQTAADDGMRPGGAEVNVSVWKPLAADRHNVPSRGRLLKVDPENPSRKTRLGSPGPPAGASLRPGPRRRRCDPLSRPTDRGRLEPR